MGEVIYTDGFERRRAQMEWRRKSALIGFARGGQPPIIDRQPADCGTGIPHQEFFNPDDCA